MPTVQIDKVTDVKSDQRGTSCKMHAGSDYWFVNEDATPHIGKAVEIEVTEKTSARGNKYRIARIIKVIEGATASGNGHITWDDYRAMAEAAHELAKKLEPDAFEGEGHLDRSTARAAILNTVMIAYSNGKIFVPEEEAPF